MIGKTGLLAALAVAGLTLSAPLAYAGCPADDHIDGSTAAQATQKMEHAGYAHVRDLKKGCDNYWHANAEQNGKPEMIVLAPSGKVMVENDAYTGAAGQSASN